MYYYTYICILNSNNFTFTCMSFTGSFQRNMNCSAFCYICWLYFINIFRSTSSCIKLTQYGQLKRVQKYTGVGGGHYIMGSEKWIINLEPFGCPCRGTLKSSVQNPYKFTFPSQRRCPVEPFRKLKTLNYLVFCF